GERDDVGLVGEGVEEGVGREVYFTLGTHCSDPADWPRGHQGLKRIMRQPVRLGIALVEHASLLCPLGGPSSPFSTRHGLTASGSLVHGALSRMGMPFCDSKRRQ